MWLFSMHIKQLSNKQKSKIMNKYKDSKNNQYQQAMEKF